MSCGTAFTVPGGADGHEDRGFDGLVGQMDLRTTSAGRCRMKEVEREAHWTILSVAVAGARQTCRESFADSLLGRELPDAVVPGAEDAAGSNVLAMIQNAAIPHRQAAVVARAHEAHLAMDASLLPLEAHGLMRIEAAAANAVADARCWLNSRWRMVCRWAAGAGVWAMVRAGAAASAAAKTNFMILMVSLLL